MPVYLPAAGNASAPHRVLVPGPRPCYPSDLTGEQWAVLEPRARQVMADLTIA